MTARAVALVVVVALASASASTRAGGLTLEGDLVQGGLIVGRVAPGSLVWADGRRLRVSWDGVFIFGLGGSEVKFVAAEGPLFIRFCSFVRFTKMLLI